jgi:hypothetical protein
MGKKKPATKQPQKEPGQGAPELQAPEPQAPQPEQQPALGEAPAREAPAEEAPLPAEVTRVEEDQPEVSRAALQQASEPPGEQDSVRQAQQAEASRGSSAQQPEQVSYEELNEYHKLIYPWQQHLAPQFNKYYYYNPFTGESVWTLPQEITAKATLFFQRVRETELERRDVNMEKFLPDIEEKKVDAKKITELDYMKRPARKQVETPITQRFAYRQGDEIYNIWYDKFLSDDKFKEREQAPTKINPELDIGYTKADVYEKNQSYFCIHFARGCCAEGHNCRYFHHIPTLEECMNIDQIRDVFGRTRYSKQRDDMEGVGSFMSETRTLKATDFCMIKGADEVALTYECLWRHYGVLGQLEDIHLIPERCIAFIRYSHRCMAEFAKEAMANQPLESNEIMIVRWSDTDIFGQDPDEVENKNIAPTDYDDRKPKGGRLRKQRKEKVVKEDETANELSRLNEQEEMLAKRLDADREYNIVEQRIQQIQKNVSSMGSVLKKLKDDAPVAASLPLDLDGFMKKYRPTEVRSNAALNNLPLF